MSTAFLEEYLLSENRLGEVTKEFDEDHLEYWFYSILALQNTKNDESSASKLENWLMKVKETSFVGTAEVKKLLLRQCLSESDKEQSAALVDMVNEILSDKDENVMVKQKEEEVEAKSQYTLEGPMRLVERGIKKGAIRDIFTYEATPHLAKYANSNRCTPTQIGDILDLLKDEPADQHRIVTLVVRDLRNTKLGWNSRKIHEKMTVAQMDNVLQNEPKLIEDLQFCEAYALKLRGSNSAIPGDEPSLLNEYLEKLYKFAVKSKTLSSFKGLILYNYLSFLESTYETYDRDVLRKYLTIPKNSDFMAKRATKATAQDNEYSIKDVPELTAVGDDVNYIKRALMYFYSTGDKAAKWESLNVDWARAIWCEEILLNGRGNERFKTAQKGTLDEFYWPGYSKELQTRRMIELTPMNRKFYKVDEDVEIDIWLKNIPSIIVNVYQVCAEAYYVQKLQEVPAELNLAGCEPFDSFDASYDDRSEMALIKEKIKISSLANKRGLFFIDILGGDIGVRAVIRKGSLRFIERQVDEGYRMKVLNEENTVQEDGKVWVAGQWHRPDETGEILVPFAGATNMEEPIVASTESNSSVALLSTFDRKEHNYQLDVGFYVERENMLAKKRAKLVMRPNLFINEFAISLEKNLKNCTLTMTTTDNVGAQCTRVVDVQLKDTEETVSEFLVPVSLRTVKCTLQGTVGGVSVSTSRHFECNSMDDGACTANTFMYTAGAAGYVVSVQGKNGEAYKDEVLDFEFDHRMFQHSLKATLKTDHNGMVYLGRLANVRCVICRPRSKAIYREQKWNVMCDKVNVPPVICSLAGDTIYIPWHSRPSNPPRVRIYDKAFANGYHEKVKFRRGYIQVTDLSPGDYICYIRDSQAAEVSLHVEEGKTLTLSGNEFVQGKSKSLELSEAVPLQICTVKGTRDRGYILSLDGINENTRVHMFATTHLPRYTAFSLLAAPNTYPEVNGYVSRFCEYGTASSIAAELNYVRTRKAPKAVPNMMTIPSVIGGRWAPGPTPDAAPAPSEPINADLIANRVRLYEKSLMQVYGSELQALVDASNLEFLGETSRTYANLKPNDKGKILITPDMYTEQHRLLYFVAVDEDNTVLRHVIMGESLQPQYTNDCTLNPGLPVSEHYLESRRCMCLMPQDSLQLEDILTSEFEPFEGIDELFYLFRALKSQESAAAKAQISKYEWLVRWESIGIAEKLENWEKYQSNEINYFLYRKDKDFFTNVVIPALKSKLQKSFFDKYLLDEDLTPYIRLDLFVTLNCFEKILLAEKMQGAWAENCCKNIAVEASLLPRRPQETDRRILLALKSRQLSQDLMDATMKPRATDDIPDLKEPETGDQPIDMTMKYEDRWYSDVPLTEQTPDLIVPTLFWSQYANYVCGIERDRGYFLSDQCILCTRNLPEMLLALACTDLPFEAPSPKMHELQAQASRRPATLYASHPVMIFIKEIIPSTVRTSTFSVSTNYFDPEQRTVKVDGQDVDRFLLPKDTLFKTGKVYGCRAVVTNVSSVSQTVELLMQIPGGSIPVLGNADSGFRTKNFTIEIPKFDTHRKEYFFYWPAPGQFEHWPAHIAKNDYTVGLSSMPTTVNVTDNPREYSDNYIEYCEVGASEKILDYLKENINLPKMYDLDLTLMRPACLKDFKLWRSVLEMLSSKNIYVDKLWSVSLQVAISEDAQPFLGEYLAENKDFRSAVGPEQDTKTVKYDGYDYRDFQYSHLEPFTNTRVETTQALPAVFMEKYNAFLNRLVLKTSSISTVGLSDKAALCCYLLKQGRYDTAYKVFAGIDQGTAEANFQELYHYLDAFLSLTRNDGDRAKSIAEKYSGSEILPMKHRAKWQAIVEQVDESKNIKIADMTFIPDRIAAAPLKYDLECMKHQVKIKHTSSDGRVKLEFWVMDLEMLFSVQPFSVTMDAFRYMQPNRILDGIELTEGNQTIVDIPADLRNCNSIIRLTWGDERKDVVVNDYDNEIDVQISEAVGEVRVISTEEKSAGAPVAGAYCKVYSKNNDDTVQFYKDGYTDCRGRFDFKNISTSDQQKAVRFALLVTSKLGSSKVEINANAE